VLIVLGDFEEAREEGGMNNAVLCVYNKHLNYGKVKKHELKHIFFYNKNFKRY